MIRSRRIGAATAFKPLQSFKPFKTLGINPKHETRNPKLLSVYARPFLHPHRKSRLLDVNLIGIFAFG